MGTVTPNATDSQRNQQRTESLKKPIPYKTTTNRAKYQKKPTYTNDKSTAPEINSRDIHRGGPRCPLYPKYQFSIFRIFYCVGPTRGRIRKYKQHIKPPGTQSSKYQATPIPRRIPYPTTSKTRGADTARRNYHAAPIRIR